MSKHATLRELSQFYSIDDLADFHEAIDIELEMSDHATEQARRADH